MIWKRPAITTALVLCAMTAFGQAQRAPEFEVASIKVSQPISNQTIAAGRVGIRMDNAFVTIGYRTTRDLLVIAFKLKFPDQVMGPNLPDTHFDIEAKIPSGEDKARMPEMLQALLRDRFGLVVHHESRLIPAYTLTVLREALLNSHRYEAGSVSGTPRPSGHGENASLREPHRGTVALFAQVLSGVLRMPVLDESGHSEKYDLYFDFSLDPAGPDPDLIVRSVADQGLKLQLKKVAMDTVVVDRISKTPTAN